MATTWPDVNHALVWAYALSWLVAHSTASSRTRQSQRLRSLCVAVKLGFQHRTPKFACLPALSSVRRRTLAGILLLIFGGLVDPDEYWVSCGAVGDRKK